MHRYPLSGALRRQKPGISTLSNTIPTANGPNPAPHLTTTTRSYSDDPPKPSRSAQTLDAFKKMNSGQSRERPGSVTGSQPATGSIPGAASATISPGKIISFSSIPKLNRSGDEAPRGATLRGRAPRTLIRRTFREFDDSGARGGPRAGAGGATPLFMSPGSSNSFRAADAEGSGYSRGGGRTGGFRSRGGDWGGRSSGFGFTRGSGRGGFGGRSRGGFGGRSRGGFGGRSRGGRESRERGASEYRPREGDDIIYLTMGPKDDLPETTQEALTAAKEDLENMVKLEDEKVTEEIEAAEAARERGLETPFNPSLSKEELHGYMPSIATADTDGARESIMRSLVVLGGGLPFEPSGGMDSDEAGRRLLGSQPVFFSTMGDKEWFKNVKPFGVNGLNPYSGPRATTHRAIMDMVVRGHYEEPARAEVTDPVGLSHMIHVKDGTYRAQDVNRFEDKLKSLLPEYRKAAAAAAAAASAAAGAALAKEQAEAEAVRAAKLAFKKARQEERQEWRARKSTAKSGSAAPPQAAPTAPPPQAA